MLLLPSISRCLRHALAGKWGQSISEVVLDCSLFINDLFNEIIDKDQTLDEIKMQLHNAFEHYVIRHRSHIHLIDFAVGP